MSAAITIYQPDQQGTGVFDGGRITEIKPNPHRAFEIMSYVLAGEIGHYDTLGTRSRVKRGGAQVMQTGSGVSHEEEMFSGDTQFSRSGSSLTLSKP